MYLKKSNKINPMGSLQFPIYPMFLLLFLIFRIMLFFIYPSKFIPQKGIFLSFLGQTSQYPIRLLKVAHNILSIYFN